MTVTQLHAANSDRIIRTIPSLSIHAPQKPQGDGFRFRVLLLDHPCYALGSPTELAFFPKGMSHSDRAEHLEMQTLKMSELWKNAVYATAQQKNSFCIFVRTDWRVEDQIAKADGGWPIKVAGKTVKMMRRHFDKRENEMLCFAAECFRDGTLYVLHTPFDLASQGFELGLKLGKGVEKTRVDVIGEYSSACLATFGTLFGEAAGIPPGNVFVLRFLSADIGGVKQAELEGRLPPNENPVILGDPFSPTTRMRKKLAFPEKYYVENENNLFENKFIENAVEVIGAVGSTLTVFKKLLEI